MNGADANTLVLRDLARKLKGPGGKVSDRAECIARVGYLMPTLTDRGLSALLILAEHLARTSARDLSSEWLAEEQAARENRAEEAAHAAVLCVCGDRRDAHDGLICDGECMVPGCSCEAFKEAEQAMAREGFGCHHAAPCAIRCPAKSFRPVEPVEVVEEREALITLLDLQDPSGDRLRVQHDRDDGRSFVVLGEPDAETAFELGPNVGARITGTLRALPEPPEAEARLERAETSETVKQGKASEKQTFPPGGVLAADMLSAWLNRPEADR